MKLMIHGVAGLFYHAMLDVVHSATGFMQQYFSEYVFLNSRSISLVSCIFF